MHRFSICIFVLCLLSDLVASDALHARNPQITSPAFLLDKRQAICQQPSDTICPDMTGCCPLNAPCTRTTSNIPLCQTTCLSALRCSPPFTNLCCPSGSTCDPANHGLCAPTLVLGRASLTSPPAVRATLTGTGTATPRATAGGVGDPSAESRCRARGGACILVDSCSEQGGSSTAGLCPGGVDVRCCSLPLDEKCGGRGGAGCVSTEFCAAKGGESVSGLCGGPGNIRCCVGGAAGNGTGNGTTLSVNNRTTSTVGGTRSVGVTSSSERAGPSSSVVGGGLVGIKTWGMEAVVALAGAVAIL
ncbi:hypothetical protein P152DRAFT_472467 [Eremomyces bilateralis CBS 781.70]|uniref:GPI anchored protein n=1 Tax=Eremomyces bilateralis CBS 781.70 TaxID=1392243 RepID=A0A6G1G6G4_9PEZI|nr:uncharacterized protein P152DRAFT_472467 [Eremomyces bilateralis CBS 781.70]KAF1813628.1 hypothetical protein P152DRAFT_472467 [Eremomyces bilateralis CBS 781.70]